LYIIIFSILIFQENNGTPNHLNLKERESFLWW